MTIDLSLLPAPAVIEPLDYETLLAARKAALIALWPEADRPALIATLALESEALTKYLQESTYRELILRARINDAAHACMLAYATGPDLDQIGANYGVPRLILTAANLTAIPPIAAVLEPDTDYRDRILLSLAALSVAGPEDAYRYHARSASGDVLDAAADSPTPGNVTVTLLSRLGDGTPSTDLLSQVDAILSAKSVRPLTDHLTVRAATIVGYTVTATLTTYPGPDAAVVLAEAQAALANYLDSVRRIGYDITRSGIYAALHRPGVQRVTLTAPSSDITIDALSAGHCIAVTVTLSGTDE
jgi:phage-related baseplate assembly protein